MFNIKGSINSVVIGNCDTAWQAGIHFWLTYGYPIKVLGHVGLHPSHSS